MKRIVPLLAGLFLLVALFATPASAVPALPHAFYGEVKINKSLADIGTTVEARGIGIKTGIEGNPITVTEPGKYGGPGGLDPKLVVQGDDIEEGTIIKFYVNEVYTGQTAKWHSGEVTEFPLSLTTTAGGGGGGGGVLDTTPPRISDISVSNITETSADISWKTQELSDSQVEYWASPGKRSPLDEEMVIYHLVYLTGLTPGTIYYYETRSCDRADNLSVSDEDSFTTLGEAPAAIFSSSDLSISPSEVNIGEMVTINATVANTGSATSTYEVTLKINGVLEATKDITLKAGASKEVTFTTSRDVAGSYSVDVNGLSGSFTVLAVVAPAPAPAPPPPPVTPPVEPPTPPEVTKPPINWPVVGGIIGGVIVVGLLIFFFVVRRRAY